MRLLIMLLVLIVPMKIDTQEEIINFVFTDTFETVPAIETQEEIINFVFTDTFETVSVMDDKKDDTKGGKKGKNDDKKDKGSGRKLFAVPPAQRGPAGPPDMEGLDTSGFLDTISGNTELLSFVNAVSASALMDAIHTSKKFTVFAPTNDAFRTAIQVFDISPTKNDVDLWNLVLSYHVVPGETLKSGDLTDNLRLDTAAKGQDPLIVKIINDTINVVGVGSTGVVTTSDIVVGKIIVHVIDAVLMPDLSG